METNERKSKVVVPGSLASILSGHRRAPRRYAAGPILYPSPASPFLITSEAEHKQQEAPHLLQRQFLLVINTRISMACCSGNCGCGAGCKCGTGCGGSSGGFEAATESGGCDCSTCKCGTSCGCN
ncbi:hypothetical protein PVAP13_3KG081543 [Panicum virgatum]|uniref:Metallothionein-like protein n=1 Tax=Panicum virgatum TaxID=38727 RepID=A0A8T0US97_PANVG|nr:hypothetical protein PVAP13_3KG081543 [Panicum virgatum]